MSRDKDTPQTTVPLSSSWSLLGPSIRLLRQNIDSMLWLVLLPAVVGLLSTALLSPFTSALQRTLNQPHITNPEIDQALHHFVHQAVMTERGQLALVLQAVAALWMLVVYPVTVTFMIRSVRAEPADLRSSVVAAKKSYWRIYAVSLLSGLWVIGGLFLFIVPGLIMLRRYVLAPFYLVDRGLSVSEAMQMSAKESKPHAARIWGTVAVMLSFIMVDVLYSELGVLGSLIGLLVAYLYFFGLPLRYLTITESGGYRPARKKSN